MHGMKVRYEIKDMNLKVMNVTVREAEDSYVLLKASDEENNNEIIFELSHEQAEFLQDEFYNANRRRREYAAVTPSDDLANVVTEPTDEYTDNHFPS